MRRPINPAIFRESDIRGLVDIDLIPETVELIGKAIGTFMRRRDARLLGLGRDVRESSDAFYEALSYGITSTGCHVVDIGTIPTPVLYFALHHLKLDGGVMITGSHNPPEYNGFKISFGVNSLYGEAIQELRFLIEAEDFEVGQGKRLESDVREEYKKTICNLTTLSRPLRVVVDGGNGCFGFVGPEILKRLGLDVIEIYCEPDGRFPNHHPDPTVPENIEVLRRTVQKKGADLGIGFDGDVDRIGVVDDAGNTILNDELLIIFARDLLKRHPGAVIIGEVKCSENLFRDITNHGGVPIMTAVGHSLIKERMRETGALLAGEMSGHIFFADGQFQYDDAIFAACRLLQILSASNRPLSKMIQNLPRTATTPEIRVACPDEQKFKIVQRIKSHFANQYPMTHIDGVRLDFGDGWALIRASNTQPALTLRFEAKTAERLEEIQKIVRESLKKDNFDFNFLENALSSQTT